MSDYSWTCQEPGCGATGIMPDDYPMFGGLHDCKSRGPFDPVSTLLISRADA